MNKLTASLEELYARVRIDATDAPPTPDLDNLNVYFDVGSTEDVDEVEVRAIQDYHGLYRAKLARRDRSRPMPLDRRLWAGTVTLPAMST